LSVRASLKLGVALAVLGSHASALGAISLTYSRPIWLLRPRSVKLTGTLLRDDNYCQQT
jgi:hypothetical protein